MKQIQQNEITDVPVWARDDAFPIAPNGWGWCNAKGKLKICDSLESLTGAIRDDRDGSVVLVWAPGHPRMILPEELEGMDDALRFARARWAQEDSASAQHRMRWFGFILLAISAYTFFAGFMIAALVAVNQHVEIHLFQRIQYGIKAVINSTQCGIASMMFVIFALIPWFQARKQKQKLGTWTKAGIAAAAPSIRFATWLERQKAPVTKIFLSLLTLVALAQILCKVESQGWSSLTTLFQTWDGTTAAGMIKDRYHQGEWWRLFTAPLLHGNVVHFLMNAAALAYLGKRMEVFARWPHLPLVFLFGACIGGEASARWVNTPSVGASGGLMGWLGFLMVFETLHKQLIPSRARRQLAAGVIFTALIGIVGYQFIDNAAHAGGLVAGMLYAAIVFPASSSTERPNSNFVDRLAGSAALAMIMVSTLFAIWKIIHAI